MNLTITNSSKHCYLDCAYRYFLSYMRRLTPHKTPPPLFWGGLVHEIIAILALKGLGGVLECIEQQRKKAERGEYSAEDIEQLEEMLEPLERAAEGYALKYSEDDHEVIFVEKKFSLTLEDGHIFKGRIDKVTKKDGKYYLWETKTAAQTGDAYYDKLPLDSQLKGYLLALRRVFGIETNRVIYDVIKKPMIKIKKGETVEAFAKRLAEAYLLDREKLFERRTLRIPQLAIESYYGELNGFAKQLLWSIENGIFSTHHAPNRIGRCSFMPLCLNGEERMFYTRDAKDFHPEL